MRSRWFISRSSTWMTTDQFKLLYEIFATCISVFILYKWLLVCNYVGIISLIYYMQHPSFETRCRIIAVCFQMASLTLSGPGDIRIANIRPQFYRGISTMIKRSYQETGWGFPMKLSVKNIWSTHNKKLCRSNVIPLLNHFFQCHVFQLSLHYIGNVMVLI